MSQKESQQRACTSAEQYLKKSEPLGQLFLFSETDVLEGVESLGEPFLFGQTEVIQEAESLGRSSSGETDPDEILKIGRDDRV